LYGYAKLSDILLKVYSLLVHVGRGVSELVWYWVKGPIRIYTRREELVEKALREGFFVIGIRRTSRYTKTEI